MDRRQFSQLSALAAMSGALPSLGQAGGRPIGYAAVGLGGISEIFMRACANSTQVKVTGLVTGHPGEKGTKFGQMYGVPPASVYTYETFDRIKDNPAIDAVYIGLPNSMHAEYTIRAARAGKHVLCEKPMAISSAECRAMIDACRKAKVKLMIAYRVHFDPTWIRVREIVRSGGIGLLQAYSGAFYGQKAKEWRLDRKLAGGGSLMDLGIYPMNAIRWITGEEAVEYSGHIATRDHGSGRFASVEQSIQFGMRFPSGVLAQAGSSYGADGPNGATLFGDQGWLRVEPGFGYDGLRLTGKTKTGMIDEPGTGKHPYLFQHEAEHFATCIRENKEPIAPGEEGLKDLVAMEAIYKAAGAPIA